MEEEEGGGGGASFRNGRKMEAVWREGSGTVKETRREILPTDDCLHVSQPIRCTAGL